MDHGLLVRHPEDHGLVVAVLEAEQFGSDGLIAAGLLPQVGGQDHGHLDFLPVDPVHFLADDRLDLFDDAHSEREHGIDPGGNAADVAAAHQELMTYGLRVFRVFLDPAPQHFGHSHDDISPCLYGDFRSKR